MTAAYYLDANTMIAWAESKAKRVDPRAATIGARLEQMIDDSNATVALSEVTLGEFQSHMCIHWRNSHPDFRRYNAAWFENVQGLWMRWVHDGHLIVLDAPPRALEKALVYVTSATREHKRNFRIWDAMHLGYASHWARTLGEKVHLVTSDNDFSKFTDVFPAFKNFVELLDLSTTSPI